MDEFYSARQVESILDDLGIRIVSETDTNFICYCVFHRNTDTPALSISKENGKFLCFAPQCDEHGNFIKLITSVANINIYAAKRMIDKYANDTENLVEAINNIFDNTNQLPTFDQNVINDMHDGLWSSPAHTYMKGRQFQDKTLSYFGIGYSVKKNLVAIPVHDWDGAPVGVVGRSLEGKMFKNSKNLPSRKILFNAHRAKKTGESVIIVESAMDAMRIHQAGFPNVVATNGGFFTEAHQQIIGRYFNEVIIMTDHDKPKSDPECKKCKNTCLGHAPGQILAVKMEKDLAGKHVRFSCYDWGIVYPHYAKDAGQMTDEEIAQCIKNSISSAEHIWMANEFPELHLRD